MAVIIASSAVYVNTLSNGFVYDDIPQIVQNPWILDIRFLPEIFSTNVWGFQGITTNYYRPLLHVIYLMSYQLFGLQPWGFHLVNIVLNAGVSVLVFLIASRLFPVTSPQASPFSRFLPFIAAMLFAVHPIHTEVVAWAGGVTDLSFALFFLLALYLYILSAESTLHQKGFYLLSVAAFFLATLCKEPALTFPFILVVYDYAFRREAPSPFEYLKRYSLYMGAALVYFILRFYALGGFAPVRRHGELSAYEYIINAFSLFRQYMQKLVLPIDLSAYHVFSPLSSLSEQIGLVSLAVSFAFAFAVLFAMKKNRPAFFALVLIIVPLLPSLYIPGTGENTFSERYLYLPSFGFVLLVALLAERIASSRPRWSGLLAGALLIVSVLFAFGSVKRNAVWKTDETLWRDVVQHYPNSAVPHYNLACALNDQGRIDEAIKEYQNAIRIQPAAVAYKRLGMAYQAKGFLAGAIEQYAHAIQLKPADADAHALLAAAYADSGDMDSAIDHFRMVVQLQPDSAGAHYDLGRAYLESGRSAEAISYLRSAVQLNPSDPLFRSTLNKALSMKGAATKNDGRTGGRRDQ